MQFSNVKPPFCCAGDEVVTVKTPAFAESVTEGDVRWEKGLYRHMMK